MRRLFFALLLCVCPANAAEPAVSMKVPYRLTDTKHLMVRVKFNGHGPYNFIIDTGAPMMVIAPAIATKAGLPSGDDGWAKVERMEVEGGLTIEGARARIEEPFQLRGMNALGLAGVKLDGILGYEVLARFRIEIDLTESAMIWTRLDRSPPEPLSLAEMSQSPVRIPGSLAVIEGLTRFAAALLPKPKFDTLTARGFLGFEFRQESKGARLTAVLSASPAATAGVKAKDLITHVQLSDGKVQAMAGNGLRPLLAGVVAGDVVKLKLLRNGKGTWLALTAGEGVL